MFSGKSARDGEVGRLDAKVGLLVVKQEFLRKASGR